MNNKYCECCGSKLPEHPFVEGEWVTRINDSNTERPFGRVAIVVKLYFWQGRPMIKYIWESGPDRHIIYASRASSWESLNNDN